MADIDPAAIEVMRTSVRRILAQEGHEPPKQAFDVGADLAAYWAEAERIHGRPDLALRIATELPVGGFGRTSYAFASAATWQQSLQVFCRETQRAMSNFKAELRITGHHAELVLRGPEVGPVIEMCLAIIALRSHQLVEPVVRVTGAGLPRALPDDTSPWEHVFGVRPVFGLDRGYLVMPADQIRHPMRTADAAVRAALGSGPAASIADRTRAHLRAWVRESHDAGQVAQALGMSLRTFQRRLGEEGLTFRQVVLHVKVDVARQLLDRGDLSIAEVASAVGFNGVAAFSRAFSQATGAPPSEYRDRRRPPK